jgi:hypothetical protein
MRPSIRPNLVIPVTLAHHLPLRPDEVEEGQKRGELASTDHGVAALEAPGKATHKHPFGAERAPLGTRGVGEPDVRLTAERRVDRGVAGNEKPHRWS